MFSAKKIDEAVRYHGAFDDYLPTNNQNAQYSFFTVELINLATDN